MSIQPTFHITPVTVPEFLGTLKSKDDFRSAVIESYLKNVMERALSPRPVKCGSLDVETLRSLNLLSADAGREEDEYAFRVRIRENPGKTFCTQSIRQLKLTGDLRFHFKIQGENCSGLYYMVTREENDLPEGFRSDEEEAEDSVRLLTLTVRGSDVYLEDTERAAFDFYNAYLSGDSAGFERIMKKMDGLQSVMDAMRETDVRTPSECLDLFYDYLSGPAFDLFVSLLVRDLIRASFQDLLSVLERGLNLQSR